VETYHRKNPREPWQKDSKGIYTLVAGPDLVVRYQEKPGNETFTFYPLAPRRFLVQARFGSNSPFYYGVLEIQNGEGILSTMNCENLDEATFRKAGGTIISGDPKRMQPRQHS
jgi:hypothetical protein